MPKLGKLRLKNYVTFKKLTFDFDKVGITHIKAHNKDGETGDGKSTNGAGKSVMFGAIPELHWGASPTGKDTVKSQQASVIAMEYKDVGGKGDSYDVQRRFGKKKGFRILRNGEDTSVRTIDLASKRAQAILGMGETDFYTRVLIDALNPHPLINGTAAQRQEFFVDFFGLHSADSIRKLLLAEYREAQQHRASYLEVRSMFEEQREKAIPKDELNAKEEELAELLEKQATILKKFRKTQAVRDLLMFEADNKALIKKVRKIVGGGGFDYVMETVRTEIKILKGLLNDAQAWVAYDKAYEAYESKYTKIASKLNVLHSDWANPKRDKYARKAREAQVQVESLQAQLKRLDKADKPEKVDEPKHTYDDCVANISRLTSELEHASQFHKGKCPTCGSSVEARSAEAIRDDLDKWKTRRSSAKQYEEYRKARQAWKERQAERDEIEAALTEAERTFEGKGVWIQCEELAKLLPEAPDKPDVAKRPNVDGVEEQLEEMRAKLEILKAAQPIIDKIHEVDQLTEEQRERAAAFDALGDTMTKINNKVSVLTAEVNSAKEAHNQLDLLASRGKALKRKAADEPILKALIEAYSNKGLKKLMIERYAKLLQDQINKFKKLFFVEDFTFEFRYGTKLEFLVHRKYPKYTKTTDVKKLSGAERRLFTILLVVATITLLPKTKRCNVLILDEPDANAGPSVINTLVKALPVLNKIIPHIIVVSPNEHLEIPGAEVYTVVKHKGVSTLHKGAM